LGMALSLGSRVPAEPRLPRGPSVHFEFKALPDFFVHSDPRASEEDIGAVPARFGLLDSSPDRWKNLDGMLNSLEQEFPEAKFKVIWAGRHGQGWHNLAEAKYGTKAWDECVVLSCLINNIAQERTSDIDNHFVAGTGRSLMEMAK